MTSDSKAESRSEKEEEEVDDRLVDRLVDEIETSVEDFADAQGANDEEVDTAVYTCAVQHAVDSGIEKEQFLAMLDEMFEESREMGELEDRMSLTRGQA